MTAPGFDCSVCGVTGWNHCVDTLGRAGPGSLAWPAGHHNRHRHMRVLCGYPEAPDGTTHTVTVTPTRIECTLSCPCPGGHVNEYRALDVNPNR